MDMKSISTRVQTAFRLDPVLLERLKRQAKLSHRTLNSYVELILIQAVKPELPKLSQDYQISEETRKMCGFIPQPTKEQLENDPKLAYLLGK
jgi:hypothetical protein